MYAASRRRPPCCFVPATPTSSLALMADWGLASSLPMDRWERTNATKRRRRRVGGYNTHRKRHWKRLRLHAEFCCGLPMLPPSLLRGAGRRIIAMAATTIVDTPAQLRRNSKYCPYDRRIHVRFTSCSYDRRVHVRFTSCPYDRRIHVRFTRLLSSSFSRFLALLLFVVLRTYST